MIKPEELQIGRVYIAETEDGEFIKVRSVAYAGNGLAIVRLPWWQSFELQTVHVSHLTPLPTWMEYLGWGKTHADR